MDEQAFEQVMLEAHDFFVRADKVLGQAEAYFATVQSREDRADARAEAVMETVEQGTAAVVSAVESGFRLLAEALQRTHA